MSKYLNERGTVFLICLAALALYGAAYFLGVNMGWWR